MPGKLNMVKNKQGKMVPDYAADGVGKMMRGGQAKMMRGGQAKMMRGGQAKMMRGGQAKMMRGGQAKLGYMDGGCVMPGRGVRNTNMS
jgi:hypothetical protein